MIEHISVHLEKLKKEAIYLFLYYELGLNIS